MFILLIIVLLHIQFYVRNILFGTDEATFFTFTIRYLFDKDVALNSLYFAVSCAVAFAIGYLMAHRVARPKRIFALPTQTNYSLPLWPLVSAGLLQIFASFSVAIQTGFVYQRIAEHMEEAGFVFELRVVFLLLLSHLLLNVRLSEVLSDRRYRFARIITYSYIVAALLLQARSRVFEIGAVVAFTHLMWNGDRLRLRFFVAVGAALIVPNIIVLGRLNWPGDISTLINGIFSFEYTVLFNNLLSASINAGPNVNEAYTFTPTLGLLLPSPVRALLDIEVVKSEYYLELSKAANIENGGFSLLGELYTNFGWSAPFVLAAMGGAIGFLNAKAKRVGRVSILISAAPMLYTAFILAFRNDLGVFIKYSVQLIIIALVLSFLFRLKIGVTERRLA